MVTGVSLDGLNNTGFELRGDFPRTREGGKGLFIQDVAGFCSWKRVQVLNRRYLVWPSSRGRAWPGVENILSLLAGGRNGVTASVGVRDLSGGLSFLPFSLY